MCMAREHKAAASMSYCKISGRCNNKKNKKTYFGVNDVWGLCERVTTAAMMMMMIHEIRRNYSGSNVVVYLVVPGVTLSIFLWYNISHMR